MSEQDRTNDPKGGKKPGPGKKFPGGPKINFNFYWIYGIIIAILIITQIFQWGASVRQFSIDRFQREILYS